MLTGPSKMESRGARISERGRREGWLGRSRDQR